MLSDDIHVDRSIINSSFVAEIGNTRIEDVDEKAFKTLYSILLSHKVIVFRNQHGLTVEQLRQFTSFFGPLHTNLDVRTNLSGYDDVNVVSNMKDPNNGVDIGWNGVHVETFHVDLSWTPLPGKVTLLKVETLPNEGGETEFIDTSMAYETLDPKFREELHDMKALFTFLKLEEQYIDNESGMTIYPNLNSKVVAMAKGTVHPVVTMHPDTLKRHIFANRGQTVAIINKNVTESDQILSNLFNHLEKQQHIYTHTWLPGDVLIWDNRSVQHRGRPCGINSIRKLIRTTVKCDSSPIGIFENQQLLR